MNPSFLLRRPPLRWPTYLTAGLLVGLVALLGNSSSYGWSYQLWDLTSAAFHQRLDLAGPVAAFAGAYIAGRLTPPDRIFSLPRFPRDAFAYAASQLVPLTLACLGGYLLGMTPLLVLTAQSATYGRLDMPVAATGLLGLVAFLVVGWAMGVVARSALVAPLAFAVAFVATLAGYSGDAYAAVLPVLYITPPLGYEQAVPLTVFRLGFFFAASVLVLLGATSVLRRRTFGRRPPGPMLLAAAPLVALVVVAVSTRPALLQEDLEASSVCRTENAVEYCVHQGNARQLNGMIASVDPVMDRYGVTNAPFDRVFDLSLKPSVPDADAQTTYFYDLGPSLTPEGGVSNVADTLAGVITCLREFRDRPDAPEMTAAADLSARLLNGPTSTAPAASGLAALTEPELRTWVSQHVGAIRACAITDSDLP